MSWRYFQSHGISHAAAQDLDIKIACTTTGYLNMEAKDDYGVVHYPFAGSADISNLSRGEKSILDHYSPELRA
jgi:hypothetical protein